jgi:hypothetical protein
VIDSKLGLLFLCLLAVGCADGLDRSSLVQELRLLAVQADRPFAQAGDTVELTALAHDPAGRELSWGFGTCESPDSSSALDCLRALSFDDLTVRANEPSHRLVMPDKELPYVGVVVVVCPGAIAAGETLGIPLRCLDESGAALPLSAFELGMKRIFMLDPTLNRNPALSELRWDGAPWPEGEIKTDTCARAGSDGCTSWTKHAIELRADDAAEPTVDADGALGSEQAVLQFYATGGEFEDDVRLYDKGANSWQARREDAGALITLWFVVRDNRGGASWLTRQLQVP